jgi:hypothetical protein
MKNLFMSIKTNASAFAVETLKNFHSRLKIRGEILLVSHVKFVQISGFIQNIKQKQKSSKTW